MARSKKKTTRPLYSLKTSQPAVGGFLEKIQGDLNDKQSILSLVLGALIIFVVGVLLFNYFNKPQGDLGPSQQSSLEEITEDVEKDNLPGKYTVKEGDTLYLIAEKYYDNGFLFDLIVKANNINNADLIETGQILDIPKLEEESTQLSEVTPSPSPDTAIGGAINQTIWGEKIPSGTYMIQTGDWLSTIAGRAYGDIYAFDKIAKANNLTNPDVIEPGIILTIP